jgi:hypothetical protein
LEERDWNKHWQKENIINVERKRWNKRQKKEIGTSVEGKSMEQMLEERDVMRIWMSFRQIVVQVKTHLDLFKTHFFQKFLK